MCLLPLQANSLTTLCERANEARILVEINVREDFVLQVYIEWLDECLTNVLVGYQRMPSRFSTCIVFEHSFCSVLQANLSCPSFWLNLNDDRWTYVRMKGNEEKLKFLHLG